MTVYLRFGAAVAHTLGSATMEVTLADGATVGDLLDYLGVHHPLLRQRLWTAIPIVSGRSALKSDSLANGQEVLFISALAGG
ncbi:MAG: MoaD/ThiS family protein [Ardenticatenaceae bacterium]|nr:MoaD/ThiS family protein [Ardenticatenaceae bacterium]HBY96102.1 hypothetical protein [Chloroflexota bacterium]